MITMTNSIFKAFLECPARALAEHKGRMTDEPIAPEWIGETTKAMAAGSLVDAIVTKGFNASADDKTVRPPDFFQVLASSYDDGMKSATKLCNKSGGWNADARLAIKAAERLLEDDIVQKILKGAMTQPRIAFEIADGIRWRGDIDILADIDGEITVIDLKSPGRTDDGWIVSGGGNRRVAWHEAWSYWFQVCGYRYGLMDGKNMTLDGYAWKAPVDKPTRAGILFATREETPEIGYIPIGHYDAVWEMIVTSRTARGGPSKLEIIKAIVEGEIEAPACGRCAFCKSRSRVALPTPNSWDIEPDMPLIDDIFGYQDLI